MLALELRQKFPQIQSCIRLCLYLSLPIYLVLNIKILCVWFSPSSRSEISPTWEFMGCFVTSWRKFQPFRCLPVYTESWARSVRCREWVNANNSDCSFSPKIFLNKKNHILRLHAICRYSQSALIGIVAEHTKQIFYPIVNFTCYAMKVWIRKMRLKLVERLLLVWLLFFLNDFFVWLIHYT